MGEVRFDANIGSRRKHQTLEERGGSYLWIIIKDKNPKPRSKFNGSGT